MPQFVIDDMDACGEGAECCIICTQPRRISAMAVAERVRVGGKRVKLSKATSAMAVAERVGVAKRVQLSKASKLLPSAR